jgi:hypothetical protein
MSPELAFTLIIGFQVTFLGLTLREEALRKAGR